MAKISAIKADARAASKGKWFDWEEGIRLLVASINSPGYQSEMERMALTRAAAGIAKDEDAMQEDMRVAAGRHLLRGWENIEDDEGKAIPYSEEQAIAWMRDLECYELYRFVRDCAVTADNFRKGEEALAGN